MKLFALGTAFILIFFSSLFALDNIYTTSTPDILGNMDMRLELTPDFGYFTGYFDSDGKREDYGTDTLSMQFYLPLKARLGIRDIAEAGIVLPFVMNKEKLGQNSLTGSGISDVWLYGKYRAMVDPVVSFHLAFKLPTGNDEPEEDALPTGEGQVDLDLGFGLKYKPDVPGPKPDVELIAGYRLKLSKKMQYSYMGFTREYDYNPGDIISYKFRGGYELEGGTNFGVLFTGEMGISDDKWDDNTREDSRKSIAKMGVSAKAPITSNIALDGGLLFDMSGKNREAGVEIFIAGSIGFNLTK